MTRQRLTAALLLLVGPPAAAQQSPAPQPAAPTAEKAAPEMAAPAQAAPKRQAAPQPAPGERVAVIGVLDKRQGSTADFRLKPGQSFRYGRLSGTLFTCDRTQPFETRQQSAAFVQVVDQPPAQGNKAPPKPRRVFSGWLFAESPSLNPFVHPVYDVWLKSCTMRFPDGPKAPADATRTRSAPRPAAPVPATPPAPPPATPG
jgi:hypothetical protein